MNKPGLVHLERKVKELEQRIKEQDEKLEGIKNAILTLAQYADCGEYIRRLL